MGFLEFYTDFLEWWGQRYGIFTVFFSQETVCFLSSSTNPWEQKEKQKNKTKTTTKKNPHQKKREQTNPTHTKKKTKKGKILLSWVFSSVAFCSFFRWRHGSLTNSGRSSAPTNTPQKCKKGDKRLCLCLLVAWQYTFSYFSLSERLFLSFCAAVLSSAKRSTDKKCHMSFLGFISLSQPIIFCRSSAGTGHIFLFSILSWGKTLKPKNRKIWYYCDLKPNLNSLNRINNFLFVNPFIEEGQL